MSNDAGDDQFPNAFLSILFLSYQGGLEKALDQLASFHNDQPGPWLDAIEAEVMYLIKTTIVEGLDITIEANALQAALTTASTFFAEFRTKLASNTNGD